MKRERENRNYTVELTFCSKEGITPRERVAIKDTSDCLKFDDLCKVDHVVVHVDFYAILTIHNAGADDNQDYSMIVVVDKDGTRYVTGSASFITAFEDIYDELSDADALDEMVIDVHTKDSTKRPGKYFITCSLT